MASMTASRLIELAERCERARDLSGLEAEALGVEINEALEIASYIIDVGNPVLSIDAVVLSLLPSGWDWRVGHSTLYAGWASLNAKHPDHCDWEDQTFAKAATPALALTAACLRALAQEEPNNAG